MKKNKKILIIVIVLILIIGGGTTAVVLLNNDNNKAEQKEEQKIEVLLNDNLKFEINSEVKLLSLVSKDNKAEIISEDETIDTSSLGEKELVIKYKDKDEEKEHKFKINIVDTTQPTIEAENELSTTQGTEIDLLKNVKVSDNSKEEIKATIEGNYDFNNEGTYNLKYIAVDSSNNKVEKEFVLKVNKKKTTTSSNTNKNNSNNSTSNKNNTTSNNQSNQNTQNNVVETKPSKTYTPYTFVSQSEWENQPVGVTIRRTVFYWYVSKVTRDADSGNVISVEWTASSDSSKTTKAVESAKAYLPTPPSGQEAVNMYNANPKVHYGETTLYVVLP